MRETRQVDAGQASAGRRRIALRSDGLLGMDHHHMTREAI
jgi:hypothetical protein